MAVVSSAKLAIEGVEGHKVGELTVSLRPRARGALGAEPLWDLRGEPARDDALAPVQLIEGEEYIYQIDDVAGEDRLGLAPVELFDPDAQNGRCGRLRPGTYTGTVSVVVRSTTQELGSLRLEVRSRKLGYLDDYRWMLSALARDAAEVLMQRFSPSELHRFTPDFASDARTLYQRFAFLQSIVRSGSLESALHEILRRPHHEFVRRSELHPPSRGVRMAADIGRQLAGPGPRVPWPGRSASTRLRALPREVRSQTTEPSLDTEANRFVSFALDHWRGTVLRLREALNEQAGLSPGSLEKPSGPVDRGLREVASCLDFLDANLAEELFRGVSRLRHFPIANQVLERREGYREIYRAFITSEAASRLRWDGGEDVYGAGQRDVATLYEYWVFLELAQIVSRCCDPDKKLDRAQLFELSDHGVTMHLRRDKACLLAGERSLLGRNLRLKLWFNRTFGEGQSWTRSMKPDCSLQIECDPGYEGEPLAVWLHFDAKYRVDKIAGLLAAEGDEEAQGEEEGGSQRPPVFSAKREDLLKMHAYRDAIRRSAGAYVLYPGSADNPETNFSEWPDYHEILPGLGAFVLRPVESGEPAPAGAVALERFIRNVLNHVANQASRRERAAYWRDVAYSPPGSGGAPDYWAAEATPALTRPPADTQVLLGYVKSDRHLAWIEERGMYNLRADSRTGSVGIGATILSSEFVLLYGGAAKSPALWRSVGEPRVVSRREMIESGYPNPGGNTYLCLELAEPLSTLHLAGMSTRAVNKTRDRLHPRAPLGAPVAVTWRDLLGQFDDSKRDEA